MTPVQFANRMLLVAFFAVIAAFTAAAFLSGCTPAQQATASSATVTGVRIAACVQGVLAEEERARLVERRLAEEAAELEAEHIAEAAREHPDSVKTEIEKVLRDGGSKE